MMCAAFVVSVAHGRSRGDRAGGACCCAHARGQSPGRSPGTNSPLDCLCPGSLLRAERDRPSPFTSLRNKPHRPDPIHRLGSFEVDPLTRMQPGASGGGRSEVKEESRYPGSGDMSGVPHPMATARTTVKAAAMSRREA